MSTSGGARLSQREVEEQVTRIDAALAQLSTSNGDMARFGEVAERLGLLRAQYKAYPDSLNGYLPRLKELSQRFEALVDTRVPAVVDRYHEIAGQIRRAEREREFWRQYLISKAPPGRQGTLNGTSAEVAIRSTEGRLLPPAHSESREQLERIIRETGHWAEVSYLSRSKLQKALAGSLFDGARHQTISELCPITVIHQLSSRARTA